MSTPLVFKNGKIIKQATGEEGLYPLLRLVAGKLLAQGPGTDLGLMTGRIKSLVIIEGVVWDFGSAVWDGPVVWDSGSASWDSGSAVWGSYAEWI